MKLCARYFLCLFFCFSFNLKSQIKDKNWLLIDSVDYEKINPDYKPYIDSILTLYHKSNSDTAKLELLSLLAENIEDDNIWVRYNRLIYSLACKGGDKKVFL